MLRARPLAGIHLDLTDKCVFQLCTLLEWISK